MALWDNLRYDTEGRKIAQTWLGGRGAGGASLTELVTKTARAENLNPEQIERLARNVNGQAFNAVFDAAKVAKEKERYPDFDVALAKTVIATLFDSAAKPQVVKTAAYNELPDQFDAVRARPDPLAERNEKVAEAKRIDTIAAAIAEPPLMTQYHNAKAAAEYARGRMVGSELRWNDALGVVRKHASYVGWKRDAFEKNALALFGHRCLPELNLLRKEAGVAPIEASTEKLAEYQDRFIGEASPTTDALKTALDHRDAYVEWKAIVSLADAKFAGVKERLRAHA